VATILSSGRPPQRWQLPSLTVAAPAAVPDFAAIEAAARERGYADGYANGLARGRASSEAVAEQILQLWQNMATPFREQDAGLLRELTELVIRVAEQVVRRELELAPADIERTLQEALAVLETYERRLEIHVNPEDHALFTGILNGKHGELEVQLIEDPYQLRGGCRIKTETAFVDASSERRLSDVLDALRGTSEGGGRHS